RNFFAPPFMGARLYCRLRFDKDSRGAKHRHGDNADHRGGEIAGRARIKRLRAGANRVILFESADTHDATPKKTLSPVGVNRDRYRIEFSKTKLPPGNHLGA